MLSARDQGLIETLIKEIRADLKTTSESFNTWAETHALFGKSDKEEYDYVQVTIEKELKKLAKKSLKDCSAIIFKLSYLVYMRHVNGSLPEKLRYSCKRIYDSLREKAIKLDCITMRDLLKVMANTSREPFSHILFSKFFDDDNFVSQIGSLDLGGIYQLQSRIEEEVRLHYIYISGHPSVPKRQKLKEIADKLTQLTDERKESKKEETEYSKRYADEFFQSSQKPKQQESETKQDDPYAILGVAENADWPTIRQAYKKLALELHPDKKGLESEEEFKAMLAAYKTLEEREEAANKARRNFRG